MSKKNLKATTLERRMIGINEFRVAADGKTIEGHASVFDKAYDMGWFSERVSSGAFSKTIKENDIRALFNHDPNYVLGRNKAGTLDLSEDSTGLLYRIKPPETNWARDLMESMKRGDVSQSSMGFRTVKDSWDYESDPMMRTLNEVRLFDVSPVTFPASDQTDCAVRSLIESAAGKEEVSAALRKLSEGKGLRDDELDLIVAYNKAAEESLRNKTATKAEPVQEKARHSIDLQQRRQTLAELEN